MVNKSHFDLFGLFIKFFSLPYSVVDDRLFCKLVSLEEFYLCFGRFLIMQNNLCYSHLDHLIFLIKDYRFYIFFELFFKFNLVSILNGPI